MMDFPFLTYTHTSTEQPHFHLFPQKKLQLHLPTEIAANRTEHILSPTR